jgi:hypothetical protein
MQLDHQFLLTLAAQGPSALTQNFETVAYRIQLLGFNTIRLPFSFQARSSSIKELSLRDGLI